MDSRGGSEEVGAVAVGGGNIAGTSRISAG